MTDLKTAKEKVAAMKLKYKAAKKRLAGAKKNGSEKQIALSKRYETMWKNRYLRATVDLKKAKTAAPSKFQQIKNAPFKKIATYGGVAILTVATVVAGGVIYDRTKNGNGESDPATDQV